MKEMKKDERIENAFLGYFGGVEAPPCDLTQAKRALPQRARRKGRGVLWKAASAFACFLVVCAVSVGILLGRPGAETGGSAEGDAPSQTVPSYYALSSAQAEHASYAQLSQRYEEQLNALSPSNGQTTRRRNIRSTPSAGKKRSSSHISGTCTGTPSGRANCISTSRAGRSSPKNSDV